MTPITQVQSANCHPWRPDRSPSYLAVNLYLLLWIANSGTGTQTTASLEALTHEEPTVMLATDRGSTAQHVVLGLPELLAAAKYDADTE